MLPILVFCTLLILLVTFLPLTRYRHWIVRGMDFPRLQFMTFAAALLIAHFILLEQQFVTTQLLILVSALCLVWHLCWVVPYTFLYPKEVKNSTEVNPDKQISILTSNVLTPNRNVAALIRLVNKHKPDVLVTLESDQWWENELNVLTTDMPYSIKCPLDNLYGMHVYSRLPLGEQEICYLVEKDVPSIHTTLTLRSGDRIRAHFLHPAPPSPTENPESSQRDAELVIVARSVAESGQPVIVTGDLNDVAWSATTQLFRKISGLLDPRVGRGAFNTFHVNYFFLRWPLDHLFHSQHFTLKNIQRLPSIGSDHFPLLTRLSFTPSQTDNKDGIQANDSEHDWAKNISDQQKVSMDDVPKPS